jgi:hypothetical protein
MSATNPIQIQGNVQPAATQVETQSATRTLFDRIGISASLLCAIHCIAAPFMLLLLPAAGSIWVHPAVHWILALLVVPLALWVLFNGYRKHGNRLTLVAATSGALLILAGLISPMLHSDPVVEFSVPAALSQTGPQATITNANAAGPIDATPATPAPAADHEPGCTDACCPTITKDAVAGTATIAMPPGGLLTLMGSLLLVFAHTSNLIACRCFSKKACADAACGCPA